MYLNISKLVRFCASRMRETRRAQVCFRSADSLIVQFPDIAWKYGGRKCFSKKISTAAWAFTLATIFIYTPAASGYSVTWSETVELTNGDEVILSQTREYERAYDGNRFSNVPRESALTFTILAFGAKPISWHEKLVPLILNVWEGRLYVVGIPPTYREYKMYGRPRPSYVGFALLQDEWVRIPFDEIPHQIYESNLWVRYAPPPALTASTAAKRAALKDGGMGNMFKRVDPKARYE